MQVAQHCDWRNEARLGSMRAGGPRIEGGACLRHAGALTLKEYLSNRMASSAYTIAHSISVSPSL